MIVVDVREACAERPTGKGRWTEGAVKALLRRNTSLTLVTDRPLPDDWLPLLRPDHRVAIFAERGWRWHARVARWLRSHPGAMYLSTTSYLLPAFGPSTVRYCTVVHDLIAFRNEPHDMRATMIERLTLGRALRRSHAVCTVSDATLHDLRRRYKSLPVRTVTVSAGPSMTDVQAQPPGKHVLCLATLCPRKNQLRLIEAHAALPDGMRERFPLLLVGGRGWHDDAILRAVKNATHVSWKGYVSTNEARALLSSAAIFAYPSLYEGFGLPVLDAMLAGVPVLTSHSGSLAEVAGDAAVCVDPLSVENIAEGLRRLLSDPSLCSSYVTRGKERAARFTWEDVAERLCAILPVDMVA